MAQREAHGNGLSLSHATVDGKPPVLAYTIDQSPSVHDAPAAAAHAAPAAVPQLTFPPLRTVSIQLVRGRNVGMAGGRMLHVDVERDADGTLGIGLDHDDRIVEVTNPRQLNLKLRDQIRAVDGLQLGEGNIVTGMRQIPRERTAFPVEIIRWARSTAAPFWEIYATMEVLARGTDESPLRARRLARVETEPKASPKPHWNESTIVSLANINRHELIIQLIHEGLLRPSLVGEAKIDLEAIGECSPRPYVAWVPLLGRDGMHIVGEFLVRISRCDWAKRLGTSPDTGLDVERLLPLFQPAPVHDALPLARIHDVPLSGDQAIG
jgi:hypothetical protein